MLRPANFKESARTSKNSLKLFEVWTSPTTNNKCRYNNSMKNGTINKGNLQCKSTYTLERIMLPHRINNWPIGNLWRSITIYLLPCFHVLASRFVFVHVVWGKLCCCFSWPYEDDSFIGAKALGNHEGSDGKKSAAQMEKETDWGMFHHLYYNMVHLSIS